jgi:riboflavin kinase / FMN adenylyltransferase
VEIIRDPDNFPGAGRGHALTIGVYDGVHLGHQAVIRATQQQAAVLGVKMAVVTFDPHPAQVLRPESAPLLLTDLDQKLELLRHQGVDTTLVVPFDAERAAETADHFIDRVLVGCLEARAVIVGRDFHFGANRAGNVDVLRRAGERHGFVVEGVELLPRPDARIESVSSTAIRRALAGGEVTTAARMLGRHHEIRGPVVTGDQRGRTIGFPTANVAVPRTMALPADAVYAAWYIEPDGTRHPAAVNVGKRPTFYRDAEHSLVEAHLIGFTGDLYGQWARVQMVELIRSEKRFGSLDELRAQLDVDIGRAVDLLDRDRQR